MPREASIHFELYRHLVEATREQTSEGESSRWRVEPEYNTNGGFADIVVFDNRGPKLVVEAKRAEPGRFNRDIDPYSPKVIEQAFGYAGRLGADYFATFNGDILVLFQTFERGRHLMERKSRAYRVTNMGAFAPHLLEEIVRLDEGTIQWDPLDRAFVERLGEFHRRLTRELMASLRQALTEESFRIEFEEWSKEQGWGISDQQVRRRFAAQAAYLLMNKLVFHKVLEDSGAYDIPPLVVESPETIQSDLRTAFLRIVNYVDFEPIYEHDPIFDKVPLSELASEAAFEFVDELTHYDLSGFDQDVIGRIYERVIPPEERHELGQYYTPPEVIDLIVRLTVRSGDDGVLDPACGTGGFLVGAYNRLSSIKEKRGDSASHAELLNQLFGIDINRFPAHLCAINLTLRNLKEFTRDVHVLVRDFFHVNPGQATMMAEVLTPSGSREVELAFPAKVDAVVANPPYIRQELIADKALCRKHLERVDAEINEQADIYVYFFTHAAEFLRKSGRLGFITSNLWLAVRYGEGLQTWFLDRFKILAVLHPWRRVFEGQLVPTCITVLEECSDQEERDDNLVKFMMLKEAISMETVLSLVNQESDPWVIVSKPEYRLMSIPQMDLREQRRWHRFLYAPAIYWRLIQNDRLTRLGNIADVHAGVMTGANDFFMVDEDAVDKFGIEADFLVPIIKSPRDISGLTHEVASIDRRLLNLHNFTQTSLERGGPPSENAKRDLEEADEEYRQRSENKYRRPSTEEVRVASALLEEGHRGVYDYLLWGMRQGFHARPSCTSRSVWFDLGEPRPARLLAPENIRGRPFFPLLDEPAIHGKKLFGVNCTRNEDYPVVSAFLNSSIGKLFFETHGRIQRGGLVSMMRYDVEELPVLNPGSIDKEQRQKIVTAYESLLSRGRHEDQAWSQLLELDAAILDVFGLGDRAEEVAEVAKALSESRQEQKEYEIPVEVERVETVAVPGAVRVRSRRQSALREFSQ